MGYPKPWVEAQLSHSDPNQISAAYNHAMYVEPRRKMMQDWADRLDLLEQGEIMGASAHLTIRIDGVPMLDESSGESSEQDGVVMTPAVLPVMASMPVHRLSAVPARPLPEPVVEVAVSDLQRERMEMLDSSAVEAVSAANLNEVITAICCDLMSRHAPLLETT